MDSVFAAATIGHVAASPASGDAAETVLTRQNFESAISEITAWDGYAETPLYAVDALASELQVGGIYYKDEGPRFGLGSFKALGGAYAGLRVIQRALEEKLGRAIDPADIRNGSLKDETASVTLASATDGNHGRSLAWGASMFGAPCRIYIHKDVSQAREKSIAGLGADVIRIKGDYDDSVRMAREEAEENGWFVVSDTSWDGYVQPPKDVMSGYGVMVDELVAQMGAPATHVFLQGGVGGLAAAVTARLRQHWGDAFRVVVVEPDLAACLYESGKSGLATSVNIETETVMAGLSCGEPSQLAWAILNEEASDYLTIPDSLVGPTMRLLGHGPGDDPKIVAGESAVCGLAGLIAACQNADMKQALGLDSSSRALMIGSEGATDPEIYDKIMSGELTTG